MTKPVNNANDKFWSLLERIEVAMLTTRDGEVLRSRPMHVNLDKEKSLLWIFSDARHHTAQELDKSPDVNLSFVDLDEGFYVSVSGRASVVDDKATAEQFWNVAVAGWYEKGLDDPNMRLIRVRPEQAEYWDEDQRTMVQLYERALAAVTTDPPDLAENRKLQF